MALQIIDGQLTNRHHHRWPKKQYTIHPPPGIDVEVSRRFRELPCESEQLEIRRHARLHRTVEPPPIPSEAEMRARIDAHGRFQCSCFLEHPPPVVVQPPPEKKKRTKKQTRGSVRSGYFNRPALAYGRR